MSLSKQSDEVCLLWFVFSATLIPSANAQAALTPGHEERDVGISLYKQGNTQSAIKALSNAVRKDKLDVDSWYFLGLACNAANDAKCARRAFEQAIKLLPNFPEALTGLAYNLLRLKKTKEAVREAERSLSLKPGQEVAHYVIGTVRLRQNSHLAAAEQAEAALKAKPDYPPALLLKSQALFGLYKAAILSNQPVADSKEAADLIGKKRLAYVKEAAAALDQYVRLGTVGNIRATKGLPDGLTQAAIEAARKIKFIPATKNGRPVSMYVQLEYHFNLY